MDDHFCTPQVWDSATGLSVPTPQPRDVDGDTVNLFCSGHTLLPDGRLLVAGGHLQDGNGVNQACIYDPTSNTWTALPAMNQGRWYPTATTLPDGRVLVLSGSANIPGRGVVVTNVPQIWDGNTWHDAATYPGPPPLYPRLHLLPDGRLVATGTNAETPVLTEAADLWSGGLIRPDGERQYAPSVMYEPGRVVYLGGGNDAGSDLPTARTSVIDLDAATPVWQEGAPMAFRRRQHNATLLPDGTVLVTGGTSGPGFNDLTPGSPVHVAELWNPATDTWTTLAAESVDRCYHSTAVLLPDGRVLSAGGGEFAGQANLDDSHRDGQIFEPPYLFAGPRPGIVALDATEVSNGGTVTVTIEGPAVARVTLVRLSSVTHAFNATQRFNELPFTTEGTTVTASVPANPAVCLPGHHLLFVLSTDGVPSEARILRIIGAAAPSASDHLRSDVTRVVAEAAEQDRPGATVEELDDSISERVRAGQLGTQVTVGLTAQCPYGLGGCWGGAYEALSALGDVEAVRPIANGEDSTATVYLSHRGLPDIARWPDQLADRANASYHYRGVEVVLTGHVEAGVDGTIRLRMPGAPVDVPLSPLEPGSELAWDLRRGRPRPATSDEVAAFSRLAELPPAGPVRVTGPLRVDDGRPRVLVRTVAPETARHEDRIPTTPRRR